MKKYLEEDAVLNRDQLLFLEGEIFQPSEKMLDDNIANYKNQYFSSPSFDSVCEY
jgi:hypothetical protein